MNENDGKQVVGIDLHRQRSVIVCQTAEGKQLSAVRIVNDPVALALQIEKAGPNTEVVLETTYGWHWAADTLQAAGANVYLAHPLVVKGFRYRRVKNDVRDASDLADPLRMHPLPEAWIAPPATHELRELELIDVLDAHEARFTSFDRHRTAWRPRVYGNPGAARHRAHAGRECSSPRSVTCTGSPIPLTCARGPV